MLILYFAVLIYDAMFVWVKVAFGIATGLLIPNRIVGLLACAAGTPRGLCTHVAATPSRACRSTGCW